MEAPELHLPAKAERAVHRWRARRAREAGHQPRVVPYTGYGSTSWIRILGRAVLVKEPAGPKSEPTGARGWRNFISAPIENAQIRVEVAGSSHTVSADYGGVIDAMLEVRLS